MAEMQSHTLSILVENHFGVLTRVAALFARRGYNIDSLAVGRTEDPDVSRMTIVVYGDDAVIEQVIKQLYKLIEVIKVVDLSKEEHVDRELALIKVAATSETRSDILQIVEIFRAKVIDVGTNTLMIEITGGSDKISAIEKLLRPFGIKELARTGKVGLLRGAKDTAKEK
ncbi:Putative acetolactate synthase small subunit [Methanimicrococcus stummii]|uniref:Acetolactate synthase small subunit n=2 Tax=Methanimicrococcus stummii TaxID=3028294 RepID=A0AA96ZXD4_9EURY|nr:acetolactate synthase small subunit [Methanimicrococcus sp. Es2]WNY28910.1 Putative acetolactate synthase small subunit [Methanimicrococcus sp. Es2]